MQTAFHQEGSLAASETLILPLLVVAQSVSVIVDDSAHVTVSVTNADDPSSTTLWSTMTLTSNGGALQGPCTGVKLVADGTGGAYSVRATHSR